MVAEIISGNKIGAQIREELKVKVAELKEKGVTPGLAVVLVGDDPASQVYVANKGKGCEEIGVYEKTFRLPAETSEEEVLNGYSAGTIGGAYDRWIAYDFTSDGPNAIYELYNQWIYYAGSSDLGDMYFEIYEDDLNSSPVQSIIVDADDIVESDTGFDAFGRDVFLNEYDFFAQNDEIYVAGNTLYWIAMQMDTPSDNPFHAVNEDIIDELVYWYGDDGIWLSSFDAFGQNAEGSYALFGREADAIESASIGEIKASFK